MALIIPRKSPHVGVCLVESQELKKMTEEVKTKIRKSGPDMALLRANGGFSEDMIRDDLILSRLSRFSFSELWT